MRLSTSPSHSPQEPPHKPLALTLPSTAQFASSAPSPPPPSPIARMPCPQQAFLPSLPLAVRAPHPLTRQPIRQIPTRSSPPRRPQPCATADLHDSWRVYTKPGNNCVLCSGEGSVKCLFCFGEGVVRVGPEVARDTVDCPHCEGKGTESCIRCDGSGVRPDTRIDEDGNVVRNLTNDEVCLLPLEEYPAAQTDTREGQRETASNGVAS